MAKSIGYEERLKIVSAVVERKVKPGDAAKAYGISRKAVWNFIRRYELGGSEGLKEHSRRPQNSPARISGAEEGEIMRLRSEYGWGAGRIGAVVHLSSSTVHRVLSENGVCGIPLPRKQYPRYEKTRPGELMHVDIKQLVPLHTGSQPEHMFAALDAYSREVFVKIFPRVNGDASQEFLEYVLAEVPYGIQAMMTDNACIFSMRRSAHPERECAFRRSLRLRGIEHLLTKPYTPRTNGKVERFFGTVERELLRLVRFNSIYHRREALIRFVSYYNLERPHSAIGYNYPTPYRIHYFNSFPDVTNVSE